MGKDKKNKKGKKPKVNNEVIQETSLDPGSTSLNFSSDSSAQPSPSSIFDEGSSPKTTNTLATPPQEAIPCKASSSTTSEPEPTVTETNYTPLISESTMESSPHSQEGDISCEASPSTTSEPEPTIAETNYTPLVSEFIMESPPHSQEGDISPSSINLDEYQSNSESLDIQNDLAEAMEVLDEYNTEEEVIGLESHIEQPPQTVTKKQSVNKEAYRVNQEEEEEEEETSSVFSKESSHSSTVALPFAPERLSRLELIDGEITLEVISATAIGPFYLGQSLNAVIANINFNSTIITACEFSHDPEDPLSKDFSLTLRNNGLVLYFDSSLQVLKEIVIQDLSRTRVIYEKYAYSFKDNILTSAKVHQDFGPSYPGFFNAARDQYIIDYPGLSLYFHVPAHSTEHQLVQETPLELPGISAPVCHRICVYVVRPHDLPKEKNKMLTEKALPPLVLSDHVSRVKIVPMVGILILPRVYELPKTPVWIKFGITTSQDILADLGPPERIFYNENNKMDIHRVQPTHQQSRNSVSRSSPYSSPSTSPAAHNPYFANLESNNPIIPPTDFFYNYFKLGIDLLIDGYDHLVKKIILHTNIPSHFDFNTYRKCCFEFVSKNVNISDQENMLAWPPSPESITSDSLSLTIEKKWGPPIGQPIAYDRAYENFKNPFDPTTLYGYPENTIIEVLKNGHIATVTLF